MTIISQLSSVRDENRCQAGTPVNGSAFGHPEAQEQAVLNTMPQRAACACDSDPGHASLLDVDAAIARAAALVDPVAETELVDLHQAGKRILAMEARAPSPMPFFDNSAMDGFAVNADDIALHGATTLPVSGEAAAGDTGSLALTPGTCMPIYTGAKLPAGANAVIPVEHVDELGGSVRFGARPQIGAHIRRAGSDIDRNAVLVEAGTRITARHASLLAANGFSAVTVFRRPHVGVFSTGNELRNAGETLTCGQLSDCNRPMLVMALQDAGCDVTDLGIVPDDPQHTIKLLQGQSGRFDLLVSSGSVSVGNRDYLKTAFEKAGGKIDTWRVAVKPGKPVMMGRIGSTAFLGLPGNPYAAWIGLQLFGQPLVAVLAGGMLQAANCVPATAGEVFTHKKGRSEYVPVSFVPGTNHGSVPAVRKIGHGGSASMYPACLADGLAVIAADVGDVAAGDRLTLLPFHQGLA